MKTKTKKSISYYIFFRGMLIMLPFILGLIGISYSLIKMNINSILEKYENVINIYSENTDQQLFQSKNFLQNTIANNDYFLNLQSPDPTARFLALNGIFDYEKRNSVLNNNIYCYFVYNSSDRLYLSKYTSSGPVENEIDVMDYIKLNFKNTQSSNPPSSNEWQLIQINNKYFFMWTQPVDGTYYGALIYINYLLDDLSKEAVKMQNGIAIGIASSKATFSTDPIPGNALPPQGMSGLNQALQGNACHIISRKLQNTDSNLFVIVNDNHLYQPIRFVIIAVILITLFGIISFPIYLFSINYSVLRPVSRLVGKMSKIKNSSIELDEIRNNQEPNREFQILNDALYSMVSEIARLQKSQLQYLQLQTNPHFILNGLNAIYNFAEVGKQKFVVEFSLLLIKHLRFMINLNKETISIKEELEFTENYIKIQQKRLTFDMKYQKEIDEEILDQQIPPFTIQTFVENAFKYGISKNKSLQLSIRIIKCEESMIQIAIQDKGNGFPKAIINKINTREDIIDDFGNYHIGITNLIERLKIIYKGNAKIRIGNGEAGGANIEIMVPVSQSVQNV